jgi:hypothetical protein
MGGPTECWTLNTLEYHSGAVVCSLSDILETWDDPRTRARFKTEEDFLTYLLPYFLSATACRGILRRAARRGKELPTTLRRALEQVAEGSSVPEKREGKTR